MVTRIPLVSEKYPGLFALIDDADAPLVAGYHWGVKAKNDLYYAVAWVYESGAYRAVLMHRLISGLEGDDLNDHWNGDGLDNRRENLRACTHTQNMQNRRRHKNNKSGFKGVHWHERDHRWRAEIQANGKRIRLGGYDNPEDAARARDEAARIYHGEFARLNDLSAL